MVINRSVNAEAPTTFESEEWVANFLSLENENMSRLLKIVEGITIALGPAHTGSI